ncbi:MAG TPA: hypothetical protein VM261_05830 [Kofleriaceae bacterium]|nr:hypothetical protein [Kofleriaceae bacterium]
MSDHRQRASVRGTSARRASVCGTSRRRAGAALFARAGLATRLGAGLATAGLAAAVLAAAGVAFPREARADDAGVASAIARVRADRAALRYRDALTQIDRTLALGKASPAQLAELYRMAGELAAGVDEPTRAEQWFARWLALVPDARLPADASPKVKAPLEAARTALAGAALAIRVTPTAPAATVAIAVAGDPLRLVRSVRVRAAGSDGKTGGNGGSGGDAPAESGLPGAPISIATIEGDALVAAALDEYGNELVVLPFSRPGTAGTAGTAGAVGAAGGNAADGTGTGASSGTGTGTGGTGNRPIHARWEAWAAGTVVLAAGGAVFAWRTDVAQSEFDRLRGESDLHTFDELEDVRTRGERHALLANVAFGAAAATAVVTVVLVVRGSRVTAAPTVGADHAGVALAGSF